MKTFISPTSLQCVSEFLDAKGCGLSTGSDIPNFVMDSLQDTFYEEGGVVVVTQKAGVHPYVFRAVCNAVYEIVCMKLSHCLWTHTHTYHQGTAYMCPLGGLIVSAT